MTECSEGVAKVARKQRITPQSCKAKGRNFQNWIVGRLVGMLNLDPKDVYSTSMGAPGEDVKLGVKSREVFPYSIEAKARESLNLWSAWGQAKANAGKYQPLLFVKRNHQKPLVVLDADHFLELVSRAIKSQKTFDN